MALDRNVLRDWHRLFGLLLTDFFTDSPFSVEIERDLSQQQQLLDVLILRRGRGRYAGLLPDGLTDLVEFNLLTFKSHREALDAWALRELIAHYVAYRKLVSPSPTELLPEEKFRLNAVCARFPHNLAQQVPWQKQQAGVYDCWWGLDKICVIVAGELSREPRNAPLHLFSASSELIGFGRRTYQRHSEHTSQLLQLLLKRYQGEDLLMPFTMKDFEHWYTREFFPMLTVEEQSETLGRLPAQQRRQLLESLPPEERLAGLSAEQIQQYLDQLTASSPARPRKQRRKR